MIQSVRIYQDWSSRFVFEDGVSLLLPESITPLTFLRSKKAKSELRTLEEKGKEKSASELLPKTVIQAVDCLGSVIMPYFQSAIGFMNLHLPQTSFVYFRSLLDRQIMSHSQRFTSDIFEFRTEHIVVESDGSIQFGSKNGLAALTMHADGVRLQFKYFSLVFHDENEKKKKFEINNENKEMNLYTWELKFYSIFQLKSLGYLTFPISVLEKIQTILKENDNPSVDDFENLVRSCDDYEKKVRIKFPSNICFQVNSNKTNRRNDKSIIKSEKEKKKMFLEYYRKDEVTRKVYTSEINTTLGEEEVLAELSLGSESINLYYSNHWNSVVYFEESGGVWTRRDYARSVFPIVHADVFKNISNLLNFLKRNNPCPKVISNRQIEEQRRSNRRKIETTNYIGEFKCFENGTIHIAFADDRTILESKGGKISVVIGGKLLENLSEDKLSSVLPELYFNEYVKWKSWVDMTEKEKELEVERTNEIMMLLERSKERMKETQKIINRNRINNMIQENLGKSM